MAGKSYISRNRILGRLGFTSYAAYLRTPLWARIRVRVMARDRWICRLCRKPARAVHHLNYSRPVLFGTNLQPLVALCNRCHERLEFAPNGSKRTMTQMRRAWKRARPPPPPIPAKRQAGLGVGKFWNVVQGFREEQGSHLRSIMGR